MFIGNIDSHYGELLYDSVIGSHCLKWLSYYTEQFSKRLPKSGVMGGNAGVEQVMVVDSVRMEFITFYPTSRFSTRRHSTASPRT